MKTYLSNFEHFVNLLILAIRLSTWKFTLVRVENEMQEFQITLKLNQTTRTEF